MLHFPMEWQREEMRLRICSPLTMCLLCALIMIGCEEDTRIRIDGENPPTFRFTGSGQVYFMRVIKEPSEPKDWEKNEGGIWQLNLSEETKKTSVSNYPAIKYGQTPVGFIQVVPKDGLPPPLEEGKTYFLFTPTIGANGDGIKFTIKNGRSIELN
jgi:hypothetical protein